MVKQKYIDLMRKSLDGEISAEQEKQLSKIISENSEANEYYQQLLKVEKILTNVKDVEPPTDLKSNIMHSIDSDRYRRDSTKSSKVIEWHSFFQRYRLQTSMAIAAGIIIGLFLYPLINHLVDEKEWGITGDIMGTIGPNDSLVGYETESGIVNTSDLHGAIDIQYNKEKIKITFNLTAQDNFKVRMTYQPADLTILAIQPQHATDVVLHRSQGEIEVSVTDKFSILFNRHSADQLELPVTLFINNLVVYTKVFSVNSSNF